MRVSGAWGIDHFGAFPRRPTSWTGERCKLPQWGMVTRSSPAISVNPLTALTCHVLIWAAARATREFITREVVHATVSRAVVVLFDLTLY